MIIPIAREKVNVRRNVRITASPVDSTDSVTTIKINTHDNNYRLVTLLLAIVVSDCTH